MLVFFFFLILWWICGPFIFNYFLENFVLTHIPRRDYREIPPHNFSKLLAEGDEKIERYQPRDIVWCKAYPQTSITRNLKETVQKIDSEIVGD